MHVDYLCSCSTCYKSCDIEGRNGIVETMRCPKCGRTLRGSEAREFHNEAMQHYTKGLRDREEYRKQNLLRSYPYEISVFQMEFKGSKDRGLYTVYGYLLPY